VRDTMSTTTRMLDELIVKYGTVGISMTIRMYMQIDKPDKEVRKIVSEETSELEEALKEYLEGNVELKKRILERV